MSCTLLVSKLLKSSEDKAEQEENIPFILMTFLVSKLETSKVLIEWHN